MRPSIVLCTFLAVGSVVQADTPEDLLRAAREALANNQTQQALELAGKAIAQDPKAMNPYLFRAALHDRVDKYAEAVADYSRVLALDAKQADVYQLRGLVNFKAGNIEASIADFDRYIELRPDRKVSHWQRGISYYYAGRFDDGRQQFEGYQTFDSNDVENAVWRYLCMARAIGVAKARTALLKIGNDKRVPMRQIYDLFAGKLQPEDVLKAARAGEPSADQLNRQLFYAHLYLGLHHEVEGDRNKALEHLNQATEHRIGHYMWDVARVHRDLLKKTKEPHTK